MPGLIEHLHRQSPRFISFEGGEGAGKSTQIKLLAGALEAAGLQLILTREPGGCDSAMELRRLLVEGDKDRWDGLSESLLYSAARNEHLRTVIRPALDEGRWVLCDRFADSTLVYQGVGRGMPYDVLDYLNRLVVGNTWPDLTLVLDMPVEEGLARAHARAENAAENRFESLDVDFHQRVRDGFLAIAASHPGRCQVVDAQGSPEDVHQRIMACLENHLTQKTA